MKYLNMRPQLRRETAWTDLVGAQDVKTAFRKWPDMSSFAIHHGATGIKDYSLRNSHWLRPDILLEREGGKALEIIEIACSFEDYNLSSIDRKYTDKEERHKPFVQHLLNHKTYESANLKVVVIGVRGYVPARFFSDMGSLLRKTWKLKPR